MNEDEDENPYYKTEISDAERKALEQLTAPKNWDFERFKVVLLFLSTLKPGNSIVSHNRPDSIHLQGWNKLLSDLDEKSQATKHEHARVVFADIEKKSLVAGRIAEGTLTSVLLDPQPQPGRERLQRRIATLHTHPQGTAGFSEQDYFSFLTDKLEQVMVLSFGPKNILLAFKTSSTPNNLEPDSVKKRIAETSSELYKPGSMPSHIAFNKTVCAEFGLTLYRADAQTRDLFKRINVIT